MKKCWLNKVEFPLRLVFPESFGAKENIQGVGILNRPCVKKVNPMTARYISGALNNKNHD
jgi:hypothetical protein